MASIKQGGQSTFFFQEKKTQQFKTIYLSGQVYQIMILKRYQVNFFEKFH